MSRALPPIDATRARAVTGTGRVISSVFFFLGLLAVLKTGGDDLGAETAERLFLFSVHPVTGCIWLATGLIGIGMCARPATAQRFLTVAGPLLVLWAVVALTVGDAASRVFDRDAPLVAMHLVAGITAIGAALAPLPRGVQRALERVDPGPPPDEDPGQDLRLPR